MTNPEFTERRESMIARLHDICTRSGQAFDFASKEASDYLLNGSTRTRRRATLGGSINYQR